MYFEPELSAPELSQSLQNSGYDARSHKPGEVHVSRGDAYLWIYLTKRDELEPSDLEDVDGWPICVDRLGTMAALMVRRNSESDDLAVRVADQLVANFNGRITWDGMSYWEGLYNAYVAKH